MNYLVQTALTDNFTLLAARDRIFESKALARQAGAPLSPTLDGSAEVNTARNYQTDRTTDNFSLRLAASYEIDLWGRLRSTEDAALAELAATTADYDIAALTLAAEVTLTWFELVENSLQRTLLKKQQQTNRKVLEVITAQFRSGKSAIADVLQQRQLVEANNGALAELRSAGRILEHRLSILLARPPNSSLPEINSLPDLPELPDSGVPIELLLRRPDINKSFQQLQAADFRVATAVADRYPKLSITAGLTTSGNRAGDLFNNWFSNLGANLFGPLIDGGRRKAEIDRIRSKARQQYYNYGQDVVEALAEVEDGLTRERELQIVLTSLETQLKLAAETIDHVGTRYRQGAEDYQRVLLALLSHQNLQREILRSRKQIINNRVSIYRAISGQLDTTDAEAANEKQRDRADTKILYKHEDKETHR